MPKKYYVSIDVTNGSLENLNAEFEAKLNAAANMHNVVDVEFATAYNGAKMTKSALLCCEMGEDEENEEKGEYMMPPVRTYGPTPKNPFPGLRR